jgi:hypothetical protein
MARKSSLDGKSFGLTGGISFAAGSILLAVMLPTGISTPVELALFSFACLLAVCGLASSLWGLHLHLLDRRIAQFHKDHRGFLADSLGASPHTENVRGTAESIVNELRTQGVNVTMAYDWIVNALAYAFQTETFVNPDDDWGWMSEARFRAMAQWVVDVQATVRKVMGKKEADNLDMDVNRIREIEKGADPKGDIHEMVNTRGKAQDALRWLENCDDERRWPKNGPYASKQ